MIQGFFSAYVKRSIFSPWRKKWRQYIYSKLQSERSKSQVRIKHISQEAAAAACQNKKASLWCARDSGKRKYYWELRNTGLESKQNLTRAGDAIQHPNHVNPKMRPDIAWRKRHNWVPPFWSISLRGRDVQRPSDAMSRKGGPDMITLKDFTLNSEQQKRMTGERGNDAKRKV